MGEGPKCEKQNYHDKKDNVGEYLYGREIRKAFLKKTQKAQRHS